MRKNTWFRCKEMTIMQSMSRTTPAKPLKNCFLSSPPTTMNASPIPSTSRSSFQWSETPPISVSTRFSTSLYTIHSKIEDCDEIKRNLLVQLNFITDQMKARPNGYNEIKTLMVDKLFKVLISKKKPPNKSLPSDIISKKMMSAISSSPRHSTWPTTNRMSKTKSSQCSCSAKWLSASDSPCAKVS